MLWSGKEESREDGKTWMAKGKMCWASFSTHRINEISLSILRVNFYLILLVDIARNDLMLGTESLVYIAKKETIYKKAPS